MVSVSEQETDGANRAVEKLTTMIVWFAAMIGLLSALIASTETPDLAYNGGPMAIALAILTGCMIIYAQLYREKYA